MNLNNRKYIYNHFFFLCIITYVIQMSCLLRIWASKSSGFNTCCGIEFWFVGLEDLIGSWSAKAFHNWSNGSSTSKQSGIEIKYVRTDDVIKSDICKKKYFPCIHGSLFKDIFTLYSEIHVIDGFFWITVRSLTNQVICVCYSLLTKVKMEAWPNCVFPAKVSRKIMKCIKKTQYDNLPKMWKPCHSKISLNTAANNYIFIRYIQMISTLQILCCLTRICP